MVGWNPEVLQVVKPRKAGSGYRPYMFPLNQVTVTTQRRGHKPSFGTLMAQLWASKKDPLQNRGGGSLTPLPGPGISSANNAKRRKTTAC